MDEVSTITVTPDEVAEKVIEVVKQLSGKETITPEMRVFEDVGFDHLDLVECIMEMEETLSDMVTYSVFITNEDCDRVDTVDDLIKVSMTALNISKEFAK